MSIFHGYGDPSAACWFIGMEEGGGRSVDEINRRLIGWHDRGRKKFDDLVEYHQAIQLTTRFEGERPAIQPTWGGLIRILLEIRGETPGVEDVRECQRATWARATGDVCLSELLPLPAPNTGVWPYEQMSDLAHLSSREAFKAAMIAQRIRSLRELLAAHVPKAVVFNSTGYRKYWEEIVGKAFKDNAFEGCAGIDVGPTRFVCIKHTSRSSGNAFYVRLGQNLRKHIYSSGA